MGYGQTIGRAHFVNEKRAVEMIELMLPGTRSQTFCLDFYFLPFEIICLSLDPLGTDDLAHNTRETQTTLFFIQFPRFFCNYGVDKHLFLMTAAISVNNKQTDRPPHLGSCQPNTLRLIHQFHHFLHLQVYLFIDLREGFCLLTEHGVWIVNYIHSSISSKDKTSGVWRVTFYSSPVIRHTSLFRSTELTTKSKNLHNLVPIKQ